MIALIGAISLTGRWPTGEIIIPNPEVRGILAVPANQVSHIQVSVGEKDSFSGTGRTADGWSTDWKPKRRFPTMSTLRFAY